MNIKTNNQFRPVIFGHELTESERKEFDYYDPIEELECASFFRYKKRVYDLCEFMRTDKSGDLNEWDGYAADSFFSGLLIKLSDCGEAVKVATYFS